MPPCCTPSSSSRWSTSRARPDRRSRRHVVEADSELAELLRGRGLRVLVQADECAVAEQEHGVMEVGIGVLVEDGVGPEERLVPRNAY